MKLEQSNNPEDRDSLPTLIRWSEIRGIPKKLKSMFYDDEARITALETAVTALLAKPEVYTGEVGSSGTAGTPFPTGWTCSRSSEGVYIVTHGFGDSTGYVVAPSIDDTTQDARIVYERDSNSFDIEITDDTGAYTDEDFTFIVVKT